MPRRSARPDSGFTLIELIVVMMVIGVLAAIAVPGLLAQKRKARDATAKSDVTTIGKEVAAYYVDGSGSLGVETWTGPLRWNVYDPGNGTALVQGPLSRGNTAAADAVNITGSDAWCVQVTTSDGSTWKYSAANALRRGGCGTGTA